MTEIRLVAGYLADDASKIRRTPIQGLIPLPAGRSSKDSTTPLPAVDAWMNFPPPVYIPMCVTSDPYPNVSKSPICSLRISRGTAIPEIAWRAAFRGTFTLTDLSK